MFEDSLVESTGRIRIHARRYLAGSLLAEALLLSLFLLLPCFFPEVLPRKFLTISLVTPSPPPAAPSPIARTRVAPSSAPEMLGATLVAPSRIQHGWHAILDAVPPGIGVPGADLGGAPGGVNPLSRLALPPSPAPRIRPARPTGPVRVSEGVAAGQLIAPIQPQYPAIARATRTQGTVVVSAVISIQGRIETMRVLSGPPLLVGAAVSAIRVARYRPWTLNGQPVEVETTISVVFTLGNP